MENIENQRRKKSVHTDKRTKEMPGIWGRVEKMKKWSVLIIAVCFIKKLMT